MGTDRNRRRNERYDSNLFAELESPVHQQRIGRGVVIDVSTSGFAIETEADLSPGEEFDCHIEIPLYVRAKVVRRLSNGHIKKYGMLFLGQGFFDKLVLRKILKGKRKTRKI